MNNRQTAIAGIVIIAMVGLSISYRLAIAGEPQSLWIWRDLLGIMP